MKNVIQKTEYQQYPFHIKETHQLPTKCYIWCRISANQSKKSLIKQKITYLNSQPSLSCYIIAIKDIIEEEKRINLFYQHIPYKINIDNINSYHLRNYLQKLILNLVEKSILTTISLSKIGVSINQQFKFYLDIQFKVKPLFSKQELLEYYNQQIEQILNPKSIQNLNKSQVQISFSDYESDLNTANANSKVNNPAQNSTTQTVKPLNIHQQMFDHKGTLIKSKDNKNKIEQMKQQQYKFLLKSNSHFIRDFFQVLEEKPIKNQTNKSLVKENIASIQVLQNKKNTQAIVQNVTQVINRTENTIKKVNQIKCYLNKLHLL